MFPFNIPNGKYSDEIELFLSVYRNSFEQLKNDLSKQFTRLGVCKYKYVRNSNEITAMQTVFDLHMEESGTRIQVSLDGAKNMIHYDLFLGFFDILTFSERNDLDIFECAKILATHEYMHMMLGHLDADHASDIQMYVLNNYESKLFVSNIWLLNGPKDQIFGAADELDQQELRAIKEMYGVARHSDGRTEYLEPNIANIAFDMMVNSLIGMKNGVIRPEDCGMPQDLEDRHYYSVLFWTLMSFPNGEVPGLRTFGVLTHISEHYMPYRDTMRDMYVQARQQRTQCGDQKIEFPMGIFGQNGGDASKNESGKRTKIRFKMSHNPTGDVERLREEKMQGELPAYIEKLNCGMGGLWSGFRNMLRTLERNKQHVKLSMVNKQQDWCKLNNRRKHSHLVIPGKSETEGALERKLKMHSVLFVDVSGSMRYHSEKTFALAYLAIKKLDTTVVFYDTEIKAIFDRKNLPQLSAFTAGGTYVLGAVEQYEEERKPIDHVIILTDAEDDSIPDVLAHWNAEVWKVNTNKTGVELYAHS